MVVRFNHSGEEDKWEGEWIAVGDHPGVLWFPSGRGEIKCPKDRPAALTGRSESRTQPSSLLRPHYFFYKLWSTLNVTRTIWSLKGRAASETVRGVRSGGPCGYLFSPSASQHPRPPLMAPLLLYISSLL